MPPNSPRSRARLLAPVALLVFALAVSLIVVGSGGTDDRSRESAGTTEQRTTASAPAPARSEKPSTYTVKRNDTLGKIAEQAGVKVGVLQELNPAVDPQALVAGQKIKLRQ